MGLIKQYMFFSGDQGPAGPGSGRNLGEFQLISRSHRYQPPKGLGAQGDSWNSQFKKQNQKKKKVFLNPPVPLHLKNAPVFIFIF